MKTDFVKTQIFNLLYRRSSTCGSGGPVEGSADCKSAIQQLKNLRYLTKSGNPVTSL